MRLSEKTLEISLCCQISQKLGNLNPIWFGLTQRQERKLGFDVATRMNGRFVILQYKASDTVVKTSHFPNPARRFKLPHEQLTRLQIIAAVFPSCVYYVFPDIGNTIELAANSDLVNQSWALDVSQMQNPFPPSHRASHKHNAYFCSPNCVISSEPQYMKPEKLEMLCKRVMEHPENSRKMAAWLKENENLLGGHKLYGFIF